MIDTDKIIKMSMDYYNSLKPSLKPSSNEWTIFASIIEETITEGLKCVVLSTGTKSIAGSKANLNNLIIDCHAENLCRRAFKFYLINKLDQDPQFINNIKNTNYFLFISQLPCGFINKYEGSDNFERKKPGRGEVCDRATCFDKLLKWNILGLQGRKLSSIFTHPIIFKGIVIGNCTNEISEKDKQLFISSFLNNFTLFNDCHIHEFIDLPRPEIYFVSEFKNEFFIKNKEKISQNKSIVYFLNKNNVYEIEIIVDGRKFGCTKKNLNNYILKLSPKSINDVIYKQLIIRNINLFDNQVIKAYDIIWEKMKSHVFFSKWSKA